MAMSQAAPQAKAPAQSKYDRLIARAQKVQPATTIVVHPCDETSLRGAVEAAALGIIVPILVAPARRLKAVADQFKIDIGAFEVVDTPIAMERQPRLSSSFMRAAASCS